MLGRGSVQSKISSNPPLSKSLTPSKKRDLVSYCAGCSRVCLTGSKKPFDDQQVAFEVGKSG